MAAKTMDEIAALLKAVKFRKKLFGGVSEDDVWRVLEQMQAEYRSVEEATEVYYSALLSERNDIIRKQQNLMQGQSPYYKGGGVDG